MQAAIPVQQTRMTSNPSLRQLRYWVLASIIAAHLVGLWLVAHWPASPAPMPPPVIEVELVTPPPVITPPEPIVETQQTAAAPAVQAAPTESVSPEPTETVSEPLATPSETPRPSAPAQPEKTMAQIMAERTPPEPATLPPNHPPIPPELLQALNAQVPADAPKPVTPRPFENEVQWDTKPIPIESQPTARQPAEVTPQPKRLPAETSNRNQADESQLSNSKVTPPGNEAPKSGARATPTPPVKQETAKPVPPATEGPTVGVDVDAAYGMNGNVPYPPQAREREQEGTVVLRVRVGTQGQALEVTIAERSGSPILDKAARNAVQRWKFKPALNRGQPVEATVNVPVRFSLKQ